MEIRITQYLVSTIGLATYATRGICKYKFQTAGYLGTLEIPIRESAHKSLTKTIIAGGISLVIMVIAIAEAGGFQ